MFGNRTLDRLDKMLDEAINGNFRESDYDETKLSKVEAKWKHFLGSSVLSKENLEKEKENVKSLVSDISHQTKTPMANMKLYASLLRESLETEENMRNREQNLRMIEEICRQTEKLEFLIESLTKMSRLESNIVEVKPQKHKITDLLNGAIEDVRLKAMEKEVQIISTYTEYGTAFFDMKWTKEALGNVLDNAVKYSPGGSKIIVSVTEYEMYTAVSVKDQGMGIREEEAARIFRRFYRAPEVQQEDGIGIGLYLTREILKKENGYIKVRSKPGQGAEFILSLQKNNPI